MASTSVKKFKCAICGNRYEYNLFQSNTTYIKGVSESVEACAQCHMIFKISGKLNDLEKELSENG